jgi:hypothetical protein
LEDQPVQAHTFHEMAWVAATAAKRGDQATRGQLQALDRLRHEPLGLGAEDELLQPAHEQHATVRRRYLYRAQQRVAGRAFVDELAESSQRLLEDGRLGRRVDVQLELGSVLNPAMPVSPTLGTLPRDVLSNDRSPPSSAAVETQDGASGHTAYRQGHRQRHGWRTEPHDWHRPMVGYELQLAGYPIERVHHRRGAGGCAVLAYRLSARRRHDHPQRPRS